MSSQPPAADVTICACEEDHVAAITTIYAHHVLHGLASFEIEPPSEDDTRQRRLDIVSRNYPYLVAKCAGEVVGYAYASPYRLRPAYRHQPKTRSTCTRHGPVAVSRHLASAEVAELSREPMVRIHLSPAASQTKWQTRHQLAGLGHGNRHDKGTAGSS
jgi:hypothetical protein